MTKKPKMMIKAIPGLTVVLLINVVVFASLYGIYTLNMCFTPTPEEIDYIRLTNDDGYMGDDISYYLNSKAEKIKLKDKKLKEIVSSSLSYDIDTLKNGLYYEVEYNEKYDYPFMSSKTVVISVNGVERKRNIRFNASDYEALIDGLSNNNEYKKMYKELPEIGESFTSVYSTGDISEKKCEEIYNTLREEIAELDFDTWYSIVNYTKGAYIGKEEIYVSTMLDSEHYSIMLPINTELKDTIYKYIELTADKKSSDVILNGNGIADIDYLELTIYNEDQTELYYYFENTDDIKSVAEFLDPIDNLNDDCYIVVASYTSSDKWSECYFTVSKENLEYIGEVSPN